jgi:hypothetical protein
VGDGVYSFDGATGAPTFHFIDPPTKQELTFWDGSNDYFTSPESRHPSAVAVCLRSVAASGRFTLLEAAHSVSMLSGGKQNRCVRS